MTTITVKKPLSRVVIAAATLLLMLTACFPENPPAIDPALNVPQDSDTDSTASENPENNVTPAITREECVIGTWQVDNAVFEAYMNSLAPSAGMHMSISGGNFMRFDGAGSFTSWREDFTMAMSAEGQSITHVSNSGETGDYGLVLDYGAPHLTDFLWVAETMTVIRDEVMHIGGIATVVDDGSSSAVIQLFDGYRGEVPSVEGEPLEGSLPFTCEGDTLTFEFDVGNTMPYHRVS